MSIFDWFKRAPTPKPKRKIIRRREWNAGKGGILTSDWTNWSRPPDVDIRYGLRTMRARSRHEAQNNDHMRHFLRLCKTNIIGRRGIVYQARVTNRMGRPDDAINDALELAWATWGKRGTCDVTGELSWRAVQRLMVETVARDGECFVRMIPGWDNEFAFALQLLDAEQVDTEFNEKLPSGNVVIMGVEVNSWRQPVAYWFNRDQLSTSSSYIYGSRNRQRDRIPAEEIIHLRLPEWIHQTRGIPWLATSLTRAHMLSGYEDAEVVAARVAAAKMGFYQQDLDAAELTGDAQDSDENPVTNVQAGEFEILPPGWSFNGWDPQHPNAAFGDFVKQMLRSIASGLGANYNTLANDLEGVNYTSLRHGSLTERDVWMMAQDWVTEDAVELIHAEWLGWALAAGAVTARNRPLPPERRDLWNAAWQPRRWPWVDPLKEIQAQKEEYALNTRSIGSIIRERGEEPDEVFREIAAEREKFEEMGLPMPGVQTPASAPPEQAQTGDEEDLDDE